MSYKLADNIGVERIKDLANDLNSGYGLEHIAAVLHVSVSRASRIVNALFEWRVVPRPWTEEYIKRESEVALSKSESYKEDLKEMKRAHSNILPFREKHSQKNRA